MEVVELGKNPITPDQPSGEDVRYEPQFEALHNEIEKHSSPTSEGGTDWNKVVDLAISILAEKSKNLLVASYLALGLLNTRGLEALAPGVGMYRGMVEGFWETLFPGKKRMRARRNALEWWIEKTLDFLNSLPEGTTLAEKARAALLEDIDAIDAFLSENMDEAPLLHQLKGAIASIPAESETQPAEAPHPTAAPQPQPEPALQPLPQKESAQAVAPTTREVKTPESAVEQDAQKILRQGLDSLRQAATLFRQKDPSNGLAYRLNRIAAWLNVGKLPPAEDGKTRIPPPMEQIKTALNSLYLQNNFEELLEYAEASLGQFLFWLDLSRYVVEALNHLGYDEALNAVTEETAQYARRLKGIEELAFSDGTPFADERTQDWLKGISAVEGKGGPGDLMSLTGGARESEEGGIAETYTQAQALLKEKKLFEAVDLLQKDRNGAGSGKSRLLRRMGLANLLVSAKKPRLALPHLLEILEEIDRYGLEKWNPDLALEALIQVYLGLKTQKEEQMQARADGVLDRISRLNPAAALRLEG